LSCLLEQLEAGASCRPKGATRTTGDVARPAGSWQREQQRLADRQTDRHSPMLRPWNKKGVIVLLAEALRQWLLGGCRRAAHEGGGPLAAAQKALQCGGRPLLPIWAPLPPELSRFPLGRDEAAGRLIMLLVWQLVGARRRSGGQASTGKLWGGILRRRWSRVGEFGKKNKQSGRDRKMAASGQPPEGSFQIGESPIRRLQIGLLGAEIVRLATIGGPFGGHFERQTGPMIECRAAIIDAGRGSWTGVYYGQWEPSEWGAKFGTLSRRLAANLAAGKTRQGAGGRLAASGRSAASPAGCSARLVGRRVQPHCVSAHSLRAQRARTRALTHTGPQHAGAPQPRASRGAAGQPATPSQFIDPARSMTPRRAGRSLAGALGAHPGPVVGVLWALAGLSRARGRARPSSVWGAPSRQWPLGRVSGARWPTPEEAAASWTVWLELEASGLEPEGRHRLAGTAPHSAPRRPNGWVPRRAPSGRSQSGRDGGRAGGPHEKVGPPGCATGPAEARPHAHFYRLASVGSLRRPPARASLSVCLLVWLGRKFGGQASWAIGEVRANLEDAPTAQPTGAPLGLPLADLQPQLGHRWHTVLGEGRAALFLLGAPLQLLSNWKWGPSSCRRWASGAPRSWPSGAPCGRS